VCGGARAGTSAGSGVCSSISSSALWDGCLWLERGHSGVLEPAAGQLVEGRYEEGSRETADETILSDQDEKYKSLDKRLRLVEAKFPDLVQGSAA